MLELDPSLYMEMVYCTASDTALQDKTMLSLLGEEEARDSKGGNTEEGKKISLFDIWVDRDGHHAYCVRLQTTVAKVFVTCFVCWLTWIRFSPRGEREGKK